MSDYRDPSTRKNATTGRRAADYQPQPLEPRKGRGPGKPKPVVRKERTPRHDR
ncbi:hypothetical protein SEA_LYMARA_96 [Arthrobacter phage Lymara]|uniref:Uncharacterized protein n=1 Tax=Arthrobacter phage Lymara TaxID=2599828 RepID=A0A5J6TYC6_9CAUD|nr:hypothetical protein HYQ01_gp096 [Arthrobacter phage Lymara]QFG14897.1 hypothetical protein SEA_LYMARA_96 [Arthrobacter phage Lymara]